MQKIPNLFRRTFIDVSEHESKFFIPCFPVSTMSYGYVSQYVTEEQELSESDCPSDVHVHVASDLTELYRRKHQAVSQTRNPAGTYYHPHIPA